ncbi:hypothetical protein [Streptomyces fulvoviolaceus]|uniref:hypothetical protein n=1 Tax=Streptomyces fulvoviolaceus TaxID=285535 RepID=UPI0004CAC7E7|nr:hypothetical protein [Streptomyces fulvoviolaceus]
MTAGWCSRTVRAAVFAAVCVLLASLGHVMMSGRHVPAWVLAAGVAVTGAVGWFLAGRERGLPLIVAVVVAAQTALHSAFSLAQSSGRGTAGSATADMTSMDMGSMHMHSMDAMDMGVSHSTSGSSTFDMLAAHLLAALLCGLWLAYGEKAAFRILRAAAGRLAAPLRLLLALPLVPDRPRLRVRRHGSDRTPRLLLVHAITSRGPPLGTAVA